MNKKVLFSFLLIVLISTIGTSFAVTDGGVNVKYLSQLVVQARKQIEELRKQLAEMKAANDAIFKTKDLLTDVKEEYEFWARFNPDAELQQIINSYKNLTGLDELVNAKTWEQKFAILHAEVGKRFKERSDGAKKLDPDAEDDLLSLMAELEMLQKRVIDMRLKGAENGDGNLTDKDYQARITQATQITAEMLSEMRIKDLEEEIRRRARITNAVSWDVEFTEFMSRR